MLNKKNNNHIVPDEKYLMNAHSYNELDGTLKYAQKGDLIVTLETTGLPGTEGFEIIYINLTEFYPDKDSKNIIKVNTLVHPQKTKSLKESYPYNHISDEDVKDKPILSKRNAKQISALCNGRTVFCWNKDFTQAAFESAGITCDSLVDVQEEARWDMSIRNPNDTGVDMPSMQPKLPSWIDILGRNPKGGNQKIQFIRWTQTAMEKGGIRNVLEAIRITKRKES